MREKQKNNFIRLHRRPQFFNPWRNARQYSYGGPRLSYSSADNHDEYGEIIENPLEFLQKFRGFKSGNSMNSTEEFRHILRVGVHTGTAGYCSTGLRS
jgi:hypothetical protein